MTFFEKILSEQTGVYIAIRMVGTLLIAYAVAKAVSWMLGSRKHGKIYWKFLVNALVIFIYVTGIIMALTELPGFESGFEAILAGSGIIALALSLAAQESLGNVINGIVLTVSKPFEVGDRIRLINSNITGYVEDITLRHTIMRTFMNSRVIIPNSTINKDLVENSNYMGIRASNFVDVTITYETDMALAERIIARVVAEHPNYVDTRLPDHNDEPLVYVYVRALSVYGVELRASVWTENVNVNFLTCSDIRRRIKEEFDKAGIAFARCEIAATPPIQ